ncbi:PREDICTED: uncharacterized protein LOC109190147 isoform X1 [Ipomoea nil]|uniref:uncharacterized protein LOC109190147 isoform X1 n=2 Tax=Ipomoea nil TaxID=35883 RepID=UPI000900D4F0|nr:PREDICTED: uncharacterized protein LOC109190147 isoform X1 [Ipomoea nil]XP_019196135.1 PREDICTED: uncharacterized protein LOC109190147 isoform X1 [Ipomoea nil]
MEAEGMEISKKRMKPSVKEMDESEGAIVKVSEEEAETNTMASEQVELEIAQILEKINRFTQLVSEMLESGKSMLKEVSNEFEERVILIHQEQMEKWQEEIKELRLLDASNEEADALLQNARYVLQNVHGDS